MSDDGYTLVEAMTALAVLGLAIGGLSLVSNLIARQQFASLSLHARIDEGRTVDRALNALLGGGDAGAIGGDARSFSFPCDESAACGAALRSEGRRTLLAVRGPGGSTRDLRLPITDAHFSYIGSEGVMDAWPSTQGPEPSAEGLQAIVLRDATSQAPLAVVRLWPRDPHDCQFDVVAGACRAVGG